MWNEFWVSIKHTCKRLSKGEVGTWVGAGVAGGAAISGAVSLAENGKSGMTQLPTLSPQQQAVSSDLSSYFQSLNPSSFSYGGQLTAPITGGQQNIVNTNAADMPGVENTYNNIMSQSQPGNINNAFNQNVENPTMSNYEANVLPYLRETIPGFSSEQGNLSQQSLNQEQNSLDTERLGYLQQGQVNSMNAAQGETANQTASMGIQSIPQEIQQAGLSNAYSQFLNSNSQYQNAVNSMIGYLGIQTSAYTPSNNSLQQIISGAGAGASIGSAAENTNILGQIQSNQAAAQNANTYTLSNEQQGYDPYAGVPYYNPNNPGQVPVDSSGQ